MKTHLCHCLTLVMLSIRLSKISGLLVFYCCTWIEWRKKNFFMVWRSVWRLSVWFQASDNAFNVRSCFAWLLCLLNYVQMFAWTWKISVMSSFPVSGAEIVNQRCPDLMKYFDSCGTSMYDKMLCWIRVSGLSFTKGKVLKEPEQWRRWTCLTEFSSLKQVYFWQFCKINDTAS